MNPRLNYKRANSQPYRYAYGTSNRLDHPGDSFNQLVKVLVLDAHTLAEIGRAEVSHHIPFGFHGQFFNREETA